MYRLIYLVPPLQEKAGEITRKGNDFVNNLINKIKGIDDTGRSRIIELLYKIPL